MSELSGQIREVVSYLSKSCPETAQYFLERLAQGALTRDENPTSHFDVHFLPYNPETKEFFFVHHKKANTWIAPGGHIDEGEGMLDALNREIEEELGVKDFFMFMPRAFFISIKPINNEKQICKEHLDTWFIMETDGSNFNVDPQEFHETRWMTKEEAVKFVTDDKNLEAMGRV